MHFNYKKNIILFADQPLEFLQRIATEIINRIMKSDRQSSHNYSPQLEDSTIVSWNLFLQLRWMLCLPVKLVTHGFVSNLLRM